MYADCAKLAYEREWCITLRILQTPCAFSKIPGTKWFANLDALRMVPDSTRKKRAVFNCETSVVEDAVMG